MKTRLKIYIIYILFWLIFFWISKFIFLFYNFSLAHEIGIAAWIGIFTHGIWLDLSATGYIVVIPCFIFLFTSFSKSKYLQYFLLTYTLILLLANIILLVGDVELYTHWKYRLDATPLLYLNKPGEIFGSVSIWVLIRQILIGLFLFAAFVYCYHKIIASKIKQLEPTNWKNIPLFLLLSLLNFLLIRGGVGLVPVNLSVAYFHKNIFVNHASVNLLWNVGSSLAESADLKNRFLFYQPAVADKNFNKLFAKESKKQIILKGKRQNILIILIESFTAKAVHSVGGKDGVTPCFDALTKQGILFNNFYASGDRSDKGIVAVFSGFPALPKTSIMKYPSKTQQLPFISKVLKQQGYTTAFYYGGDPDFANIKAYLLNGGFDKIISKNDFSKKDCNAKWGVHDHVTLNRLLTDLNKATAPFCYALFTLSSHEPYDVPMKPYITGNDDESKFLNSIHYTDKCIGDFIDKAKQTAWWKNTLVVFVADHGHLLPGNTPYNAPESFHIPMLWMGGVLCRTDTIVRQTASQTDIAATILSQMNLDISDFKYSSDIFHSDSTGFAFYSFNDGFGFISGQDHLIFDNVSRKCLEQTSAKPVWLMQQGKSFLQVAYGDFVKK